MNLTEARQRLEEITGKAPRDLKGLREIRGRIVDDMAAILAAAETEKRNLTDDETKLHERLYSEAQRFKKLIEEAEARQEEERAAAERHLQRQNGARAEGPVFALENGQEVRALLPSESLAARYATTGGEQAQLGRMLRGVLTGDWTGAEAERRAMGEGTGSLGGFFVPTPISARVIDLARNQSVLIRGGALTIPMSSAEMTIVRQVSDVTGYWRGEHEAVTESDATFEPITLKAMVLSAICRVSIELLEDSLQFGALIEQSMAAALGLEMDRAGIFGTGAGEPRGVVNTANVNEVSMGANGAAITNYDPWLDAIEAIENNNGVARATAYAPRTKRALAGLKDTQNNPLSPPQDFTDLRRFASNQFPVDQTKGTATNASTALVGDFGQVGFGLRTGLRIEGTRFGGENAFKQMQVLVRAYLRADVAVLRPKHLTKITGIIPA